MTDGIDAGERIAPVLQFVPGPPRQIKVKGHGYAFCRHVGTEVDAETRTVTCRQCGKTLDAFDVLLEYARKERTWQNWRDQQRAAAARVEQLKAEEKRVKARTKSASRKDSEQAVRDEQVRTEKMRFEVIQAARDVAALARRIEALNSRKGGA